MDKKKAIGQSGRESNEYDFVAASYFPVFECLGKRDRNRSGGRIPVFVQNDRNPFFWHIGNIDEFLANVHADLVDEEPFHVFHFPAGLFEACFEGDFSGYFKELLEFSRIG